eukprot:1474333-Karenia_brevis.AAC.1
MLIQALMRESDRATCTIDIEVVQSFIQSKLVPYTLAVEKPDSCSKIEQAFIVYVKSMDEFKDVQFASGTLEKSLRTILFYKPAWTLARCGARKKTSVNCFTLDGAAMTLRPPQIFGA